MDDLGLLKAYADHKDQEAFAQLVRRHSPWLYAAARRQLGDGHLAEDATQAVFLLLSQRASSLRRYRYLSGWLFLALGYCIRDTKEQRSRRAKREQEAATMRPEQIEPGANWDEIAPMLEAAVGQLGRQDRDAVLLRFYERKPLAEVGRLLGVSEEAARKRVERAVDRVRERLATTGIQAQSFGLATVILDHAAGRSPAGLAESIAASISHGEAHGTVGGIARGAAKLMTLAKLKIAIGAIAALVMLSIALGQFAIREPAQGTLRPEDVPVAIVAPAAEDGWVQIRVDEEILKSELTQDPDFLKRRPLAVVIRFRPADATHLNEFIYRDHREVHLVLRAKHEHWAYDSRTNAITIANFAESAEAAVAEFVLAHGLPKEALALATRITESSEGGLRRFDLTYPRDSGYAEPATVWIDSASGRMQRRRSTLEVGIRSTATYTYGPLPISDIYDAGIPRDAGIIKKTEAARGGTPDIPEPAAAMH